MIDVDWTRKLYLVRHAPAFAPDPDRWPDDAERPLTREGAGAFLLAASGLQRITTQVDVLLTSRLARGWQTAAILEQECAWPRAIELNAVAPDAPSEDLIAVLELCWGTATMAVVGHEPQLSELLATLIGGETGGPGLHFTEGGVCCLALDGPVRPASATVLWMLTPPLLRAMRRRRHALDEPIRVPG